VVLVILIMLENLVGMVGLHKVRLSGLELNTVYYYQVGDASEEWSNVYKFKTYAPNADVVKYGVYGDMGTFMLLGYLVAERIIYDMKTVPLDMIVHVGDIAYAGTGSTYEFEAIWDIFCDQIQDMAAYMPYMTGVGNHEHYYNWTSFVSRFEMPGAQSNGNGNFWFSYDYGNVHWTYMSTEHPYGPGTPQYIFLDNDLKKARQNKDIKWIFLTGHRPFYNSDALEYDSHRPGSYNNLVIEPLIQKYGVDIVFTGHMHMYERTYPIFNGTVVDPSPKIYKSPKAAIYVTQGNAGAIIRETFIEPQPKWSFIRKALYGYGRLTIFQNNATLKYESLSMVGDVIEDEFWIIK